MVTNEELLLSRQQTWRGVSKLLFWGSIHVAVITLITVLFAINGPSWPLAIGSIFLFVVNLAITAIFARG